MSSATKKPTDHLREQIGWLLAWEDTHGVTELTWEQVQRCVPQLSIAEAKQYLLDKLDDPARAAGYEVLFLRHPELSRWVREQHIKPKEPLPTVSLRPVHRPHATTGELQAAAKAAHGQQPGQWWLEDDEHKFCLRLFPQSDPDRTTVQFVGQKPTKPPLLYVDGIPLRMLEPFDEFGEGIARSDDLKSLQAGTACLEIAIEP